MTESDAVRCGGSVACPVSTGGTRRRLGSVRLTVVISALVSSFRLPRSGVEVQDAAGLPLLNLVVIVPLLPHFELSSPREPEEPPLLQLRALTPLSVPLELSFRLSSRVRDEDELQLDRLGDDAVVSSLFSASFSLRDPCSL